MSLPYSETVGAELRLINLYFHMQSCSLHKYAFQQDQKDPEN